MQTFEKITARAGGAFGIVGLASGLAGWDTKTFEPKYEDLINLSYGALVAAALLIVTSIVSNVRRHGR